MKNITIKDIAKVAGVSYATVSRALSGSSEIGADTRERVLRICREMGYTTNYVARSMVMRRTAKNRPPAASITDWLAPMARNDSVRPRSRNLR